MREFIVCIITGVISSFLFIQMIRFPFGIGEFFVAVWLWAVFLLPFFLMFLMFKKAGYFPLSYL